MAWKVRVEYPGAIYHVKNRRDRREPIFKDDRSRKNFLAAQEEVCGRRAGDSPMDYRKAAEGALGRT